MEECAEGYASFVMEHVEALRQKGAETDVWVEQRVDFSRWVPGGFGTADCVIAADGCLAAIDYKHGQGVQVAAHKNPQISLPARPSKRISSTSSTT